MDDRETSPHEEGGSDRAVGASPVTQVSYRELLNSINVGYCVFQMLYDAEGSAVDYRWVETNPAFERHSGLADAVGRTARELVPRLEPIWIERYARVAASGESESFVQESPAMGRWFEVAASRVGSAEERLVALLFTDITRRQRAELALREQERALKLNSQMLEQRVAERTAQLEGQTHRLRHLAVELAATEQRERKRLAAVLHDELQQLLVVAKLDLVELRGQVANDEQTSALAARVLQRLDESIAALRDMTRELRPPVLYEAGLIPALQWLATDLEKRRHLQVSLEIEGDDPARDLGDDLKGMLFEGVRELLRNVSRHAGVSEARLRVWEEDGWLGISVEDRGRGFAPEPLGDSPNVEGYGLFSIRERLAALGGAVRLEAAPGYGVCIELKLPIRSSSDTVRPPLVHEIARRAQTNPLPHSRGDDIRVRVLVVDDHAIVRQGIARMINSDDRLLVVGEAVDGYDAIEAVLQFQPEVVLMDLNMPRMNGFEATRQIHSTRPDITIIGLSVEDNDATARSMLSAGAAAFMSKSGDSKRLISTILGLARRAH